MKYRIEYRSSRYEGVAGRKYVVQNTGGNFHEFEAVDDTEAQTKSPAEWQTVLAKARQSKLRSVGFVQLTRLPDSSVAIEWTPIAA